MSCSQRISGVMNVTLILVAALAQACSFELMEQPTILENRCTTNADCPNATCQVGMCVAASASSLAVTLEVTPASSAYGTEPATITLQPFALSSVTERVVIVPDAAVVFGDVRVDGETLAATLKFTPVRNSQAMTRTTLATTSESAMNIAGGELADYRASLLRETEYRVVVTPPDSATLPPLRLTLPASSDASRRFDATYETDRLSHQAIELLGLPPGMWSVVALDADTGEELSTRVPVSADAPSIELTSAEALDGFDLSIAPISEPGMGAALPAFIVPNSMLDDVDGVLTAQLPIMPRVVTFTGNIEHCRDLLREDLANTPVALTVALRSRALLRADPGSMAAVEVRSSFTTTASAQFDDTLREWSFSVDVPPGQYDVVVTPPADSGCGVFAESRMIVAPSEQTAATAALLQLRSLSFLSGRVLATGPSSAAVAGAAISATALGLRDAIALEPNDDTVTRYNRSQQTTTDALGEFTLPIDVGAYDVCVKPPADSGFAWHVLRDVNVGARTDTPFAREIEMTAPVVLHVTLVTPDGAVSMAHATVRAVTMVPDAERGMRPLAIGSATADEDGHLMLLLPATIDQGWY